MFYSQFILAKKGPLGTIWIAAHLERKLRKNQVADTDIGVSVDSILFPEVPIALRLSSHLLLGVVRIYSRKVNYLFDDCSEALLKIKQAFRSTAVDLPPEESTAPYHSITLPETFDLDDFELPDNDMFQGNYVDHHVSTREQITLQDAMDGVVYSTSQFGLDERFGDGDTSQIGLDFDEDLFLRKAAAQGNDGLSGSDPRELSQPKTPSEKHDVVEEIPGTSETVQINGSENQNQVLPANIEFITYAQAPSTPGLFEEPNLSSLQEAMTCNDQLDLEDHNLSDLPVMGSMENAFIKSGPRCEDGSTLNLPENGYSLGDMEIKDVLPQVHEQVKPLSLVLESSIGTVGVQDIPNRVDDIHIVKNNEPTMLNIEKEDEHCVQSTGVGSDERYVEPGVVKVNEQCVEPEGVRLDETMASPSCSQVTSELEDPARKICSSGVCVRVPEDHLEDQQISLTSEIQNDIVANNVGEVCTPKSVDSSNPVAHEKMTTAQICLLQPCNSHQSHNNMLSPADMQLNSVDNDTQSDVLERSTTSDVPAPEQFLSLPEGITSAPSDLPLTSTPDKEVLGGDGPGTKFISGKKRSYSESTGTVHSSNLVEPFGEAREKRTANSIPDDDDLLSSILVGRRSSVLKLKPTPPIPETMSIKRSRTATLGTASKRKVLMDDTMVVHGDAIRQQLTNTEDIRRVRKKAPCTCSEISMMQRQNLEDEIFSAPIFTGMSVELIFLHTEKFDLSNTKLCKDGKDDAFAEVLRVLKCFVKPNVTEETVLSIEPVIGIDDAEAQDDLLVETVDQRTEDSYPRSQETDAQVQGITDPVESKHEPLGEMSELEINVNKNEVACSISADVCNMLAEDNIQPHLLDKTNAGDGYLQFMSQDEKLDTEPMVVNALIEDASIQKGVEDLEYSECNVEIRADVQMEVSEPSDRNATLATISFKNGVDNKPNSSDDQPMEEMKDNGLPILNGNEVLDATFGCDDKETKSSYILDGGDDIGTTIPMEVDVDAKYISLDEREDLEREGDDPEVTADHLAGNHGDCDDVVFGNDTEFLNVDDDEIAEEEDEMPSAEATCLLDNSGWSSRTRAVAKYLQTLFDKEAVHGKRVLGMDNLLNGKTRKEASRMFFETLVLKTRDYINVEQAKPFDNINIKPMVKLMISDF